MRHLPTRPALASPLRILAIFLLALSGQALFSTPTFAQSSSQVIYDDALENGAQNWSWATVNMANASPVHTGSKSISVTSGAWQALYIHLNTTNTASYASLSFWIDGGASGGQHLLVQATLGGNPQPGVAINPAPAVNTWQQVTIPLSTLGAANKPNLDGFWIQETTGNGQPVYYVDDIALNLVANQGPNPATTVSIDAQANVHPISPLIYGVAFGSTGDLTTLNAPLNRSGGNAESMYNWTINATNHAADWFFESIADSPATPGADWDSFISGSKAAGAQPMLTIPEVGWVANLGPNRATLPAFSVAKYGAQQSVDPYDSDAGNGVDTDGTNVTGNDPNDASIPADVNFEAGAVNHLITTWGQSSAGGLKYYLMDNEPSIWFQTHRDVHPTGPTMDEILNDTINYGNMIKSADPNALVMGPEEWGWSGYFYSGYDQQYGSLHGWNSLPDRIAHNNEDYVPYLLQMMQANQANSTNNLRILDYLSLHFYPQSGEFGDDTSTAMELLRNRSTRQLWDPNYVSESWIGQPVYLIPRMKQWVAQYYPGTKTAITEYNWGAEGAMNGATTQADIYGIFGQQGLDLATRWTTPAPGSPVYEAMKIYRNYDGANSGFGDSSVSDSVANPDNLSSFAAVRSTDGAMTVIVISKYLTGSTSVTVNLANFSAAGAVHVWQLAAPGSAINQLADTTVAGGAVSLTVPAQSITLLVIPVGQTAQAPTLTSLSPSSVGAGSGALTLTVNGTGFVSGDVVQWNGSQRATTFVSATQVTAAIAAADVASKGAASVTAINPAAPGLVSNAMTFTISDVTAPVTTASLSGTQGTNGWYTSPVNVTLSATDPDGSADVSATYYQIDGGAQQTYSSAPFAISGDAQHDLAYWSVDQSGNIETTHHQAVNIDGTNPVISLGTATPAANANGWNNSSVSIPYTVTDATSGVGSATPGSPLAFGAEGANQKKTVTATDNAGNSVTATSPAIDIDLTAPVSSASVAGQNTITITAADNLSGVATTYYKIDGGAQQTYSAPFSGPGPDGSHVVTYWSVDKAGNAETAKTINYSLDTTPPVTSANLTGTSGTNGWYVSAVTLTLTATDAGTGVASTSYAVDGGATQTYTAPFAVSGDGAHTVAFWSTDGAGNVEAHKSVTFNIDATVPVIAFGAQSPAANTYGWNNSSVSVPFTVTDATSGVASSSPGSPILFTSEGAGQAQTVTATDKAGNTTAKNTPPVNIDLTKPVSSATTSGTFTPVTVTISALDNLSGVASTYYILDNGSQTAYTGPVTVSATGSHKIKYWSVDKAGNTEAQKTLTFTVAAQPTISGLSLSPASVLGGGLSTGTVTLSAVAQAGGITVAVSSSNTGAATVPAQVVVAGGSKTATFTIATSPVAANTSVTISATYLSSTRNATVTVTAPALSSLTLNPSTVQGGVAGSTGTVALTGVAAVATTVTLTSSNTNAATVPTSVTVGPGASSATFTIATKKVTGNKTPSIKGTLGSVSKSATLTVTP